MPCCDDEEHSPSEFHCHGETNDPNGTFQGENNAEKNNSSENVASIVFTTLLMASFCMERLLFVKKFTLYFRRLNFFFWSIVIVLLLQQVHCQKPPVYTAESCSNESVFCFFSTKSEQTAIQQSHIINPLLTSFARSVRESIAFGFASGNTFPYRPRTMFKSAGTSDWLGYFTTMIVIGCYGAQIIVIIICRCWQGGCGRVKC